MRYSTCCLSPTKKQTWDQAICLKCGQPCHWVYRSEPQYEIIKDRILEEELFDTRYKKVITIRK